MHFVIPTHEDKTTWDAVGWYPNMVDKPQKLVWMTPARYLNLVDPQFGPSSPAFSDRSIDFLKEAVRAGRTFAPLSITGREIEDYGDYRLRQHEGRHRAWLAKAWGVPKVPVFIKFLRDPKHSKRSGGFMDLGSFGRR